MSEYIIYGSLLNFIMPLIVVLVAIINKSYMMYLRDKEFTHWQEMCMIVSLFIPYLYFILMISFLVITLYKTTNK